MVLKMKCKNCNKAISKKTKMGYKSNNIYWIEKGFCNQICAIENHSVGTDFKEVKTFRKALKKGKW